jgi:hypothetical protein
MGPARWRSGPEPIGMTAFRMGIRPDSSCRISLRLDPRRAALRHEDGRRVRIRAGTVVGAAGADIAPGGLLPVPSSTMSTTVVRSVASRSGAGGDAGGCLSVCLAAAVVGQGGLAPVYGERHSVPSREAVLRFGRFGGPKLRILVVDRRYLRVVESGCSSREVGVSPPRGKLNGSVLSIFLPRGRCWVFACLWTVNQENAW